MRYHMIRKCTVDTQSSSVNYIASLSSVTTKQVLDLDILYWSVVINSVMMTSLILEVELYFGEILHANLVGIVDDEFVVVECVAVRVLYARLH